MGSDTPDRELYRPNEGEVGYAAKINANFDELDDVVPEYDDVANAPATDGFIVYITGDGPTTPEGHYQRLSGSYVEIGGGGGGGSAIEVAEDGTSLTTDVTLIDVLGGLTASEPVADEIDLAIDESEVDLTALQNYVANEHVDHTGVSITGGTYISGGGDISASRTLSLSGDTDALDGSAGTDGQVWTSTGSGAQWESAASGGSSIALDLGNDDTIESTDLQELATTNDTNSIVTEPAADKALFDMSVNWPTADTAATANALATGALDAIGEIDATVRSGLDATVVTGTAGTGGNIVGWNADGDAVDSGVATSAVHTQSSDVVHDDTTGYDANEHTDYRQDLINSPNAPFQSVELQDSANSESGADEYIQFTELVDAAETLTVYRWGAYDTSDGTAPTGLDVQLIEGDGTVNDSANTADNSSLTGVASYSPASGTEVVKLRVLNATGADIASVGGCFGYEVA